MGCKNQGAKNRVIVIQKEAAWPLFFLDNNDPVFCTLLFATRILDLIFFRVTNRPMFLKQE